MTADDVIQPLPRVAPTPAPAPAGLGVPPTEKGFSPEVETPTPPAGGGAGAGDPGGAKKPPEKWWEAEGLPWDGKPSREEIACFVAFACIGLYSFALMPLKPILLGMDPLWLALADGGRIAMIAIGGLFGTEGYPLWWLGLLVGTLSIIKFDPIYWWAGKLWGDGVFGALLRMDGEKARRRNAKVKAFTQKHLFFTVLLTHLPIPFPDMVVGFTAGMSGVSLKRYLTYDFFLALPFRAAYMYLGLVFMDQATAVVKTVERYSMYFSLAVVAVMLVTYLVRSRRNKAATAGA